LKIKIENWKFENGQISYFLYFHVRISQKLDIFEATIVISASKSIKNDLWFILKPNNINQCNNTWIKNAIFYQSVFYMPDNISYEFIQFPIRATSADYLSVLKHSKPKQE